MEHTDYLYNKAGTLTRATYPDDSSLGGADRGYVTFAYDAALRLTRKVDQQNQATDTVYDAMGRKLTVNRGSQVDSFTYTPWGAISMAKRGTSMTPDALSSVTRAYNGLMRLTRESQGIDQDTARSVDYDYDLAGNAVTLGYPGGSTVATSYDADNRRDTLKKNGSPIADYSYVGQRVNNLVFETGADDITQSHSYDGAMRLTRLAQQRNGTDLATFNYGFNAAGDITAKQFAHRSGSPSETYGYDALHRLTRTDFGQRPSTPYKGWTYDDLGNHLTQDDNGTTIPGSYDAVNQETQRGGTAVLWDKNGNLTHDDASGGGVAYSYDRQNMLTRATGTGGSTIVFEATYDALGRRIEVTNPDTGEVKRYYWSGQQMLERTDGANTLEQSYVWGNYIDELLQLTNASGGNSYFALRHHNFNVVALVDTSGSVIERYDYNPYGERFVLDADFSADADGVSDVGNAFGHQGLFHDQATGLVYNRARMLSPRLGRFVQRDVRAYRHNQILKDHAVWRKVKEIVKREAKANSENSEYRDGQNLYVTYKNNPIKLVDHTGLKSCGKGEVKNSTLTKRCNGNRVGSWDTTKQMQDIFDYYENLPDNGPYNKIPKGFDPLLDKLSCTQDCYKCVIKSTATKHVSRTFVFKFLPNCTFTLKATFILKKGRCERK